MRKNESGAAHLALILAIVVALVSAAGVYIAKSHKDSVKNQEISEAESNLKDPIPADLLSVDQLKEAIKKGDTASAELTSIELEQEHGVYLYKVKLANGIILFFDAKKGTQVVHQAGESESEDGTIPTDFVPGITYAKAREIALGQKSGDVVSKIELEAEGGRIVYSVRFTDGARVDVDAKTGDVVRTKAAQNPSPATSGSSGSSGSTNSGTGSSTSGSGGTSGSTNSGSGSTSSNSGSGSNDPGSSNDDSSHSGSGSSGGSGGHHDGSDD